MRKVYLDYNATTPVDPSVREAMLPFLGEEYGNPSSLHWVGARARKALEESREKIARHVSCLPEEIFFTSGGTESINLAIKGTISKAKKEHVITSQIEHKAVLESIEDLEKGGRIDVTRLGADQKGDINLDSLREAIHEKTVLISIMFVNNEIGNIYPVEAIGRIARERGIPFHTDAVQAVGKLPIDLSKLSIDLLSFSAHKIYGPKGVGALFVRKGVKIGRILHGGAQEMEKRGGTENLPGIVGLAEAMERMHRDFEEESQRLASLREMMEKGLLGTISGVHIHGNEKWRIPNTLNVTFEGITNETILVALDREGIAVSSGSACASGAIEPSHVLLAMGVSREEAKGAVRFSLGRGTSEHDIDFVLKRLPGIVERIRQ